MTDIPRAVVSARRTAGVILLGAGLITVVAITVLIGWWATRPPTVSSISSPTYPVTYPSSVSPAPITTTPPPPTTVDAATALQNQVNTDRPTIATIPEGYWVPQLSSKHPGLLADGVTYTAESVLADHQQLRSTYTGVALLWSGDYPTFDSKNFWVTVVATQYSSAPEQALAWCDANSLDRDHCYAKRISATTRYPKNTAR